MSTLRWARYLIVMVCTLLIVSGCGKNIPAIDPVVLQNKLSVLVIMKPNIKESTKSTFAKTLLSWRDTQSIAFEWMPDVTAISEEQANKIQSVAYDYIIVVGNELNQQILPYAQTVPDKKWILIDDALSQNTVELSAANIEWKQTGPGFMENQWGDWVKQQQAMGKTLEWVTVSTNPIPSIWAPSEEAERISLSNAEGWYPQFQQQVKQHAPDWLVVYSPLESSVLQRMKNLPAPIMNMAATTIDVKWDIVLPALLAQMQNKQWKAGIQAYTPQEVQVTKPQ
ncbi:hypothetical protein [Paenibacillus sp. RC67]|uniref:hypothetical protein n=1 Tax=Paenibacillus sp. RC67 TaxID=3039392 RepID=UPI0024AE09F6|nr:hypothetical protein [Paenibacillus sp. RC67]